MATLYVTEPGARIEKEYKRILVTKNGEVILSVPALQVSAVVMIGSVGITTQAMLFLIDCGIHFSFINNYGKLRGTLRSEQKKNVELLIKQYQNVQDMGQRIKVSRAVVTGKLYNYRVMAMRMARNVRGKKESEMRRAIDNVSFCLEKLTETDDIAAIRGLEGYGTRSYFSVFRSALNIDNDINFTKRRRRPPADPVNALLSFGYMLLTNAMITAIEVNELEPTLGFFHSLKDNRPGLALDLIEEFRPLMVDSIVLRAVNEKRVTKDDFKSDERFPCRLNKKGLSKFLELFSIRLREELTIPEIGRPLSYQKLFEVQAKQIKLIIQNRQDDYNPVTVR